MCQCENCGWRSSKYKRGCDAFNEIPTICNNWISIDERRKFEMRMDRYPIEQEVRRNTVKFVHFGGGCGKYTNNPLTKLGVL